MKGGLALWVGKLGLSQLNDFLRHQCHPWIIRLDVMNRSYLSQHRMASINTYYKKTSHSLLEFQCGCFHLYIAPPI